MSLSRRDMTSSPTETTMTMTTTKKTRKRPTRRLNTLATAFVAATGTVLSGRTMMRLPVASAAAPATLPATCPTKCTRATMYQDCVDPNYALGTLPDSTPATWPNSDCGTLDCDEANGGKCKLVAWTNDDPRCKYRYCGGNDALCDRGGPTTLAAEGKVRGTCTNANVECVYQWCPPDPPAPTKKLPDTCSTKCTSHLDCIDPANAVGTLPDSTPAEWPNSDCGSVYCDAPSGQCRLVAWKNEDPRCAYRRCATDDACAGGGPTGLPFVDGKCENLGIECVYRWCIGGEFVQLPTTTTTTTTTKTPSMSTIETYSCSAPGKKACTSSSDCADAAGVKGLNPNCGSLQCDVVRGVCTFDAWKDGPECEPTFQSCVGIDALCFDGPTSLSYLGSCTGFENNRCRYAWCTGDTAPPPTSPPPPAVTTTTTSPPLNLVSLSLEPSGTYTMKVRDYKKFAAKGTVSGGSIKDVTIDAVWTSSNTTVLGFRFPGLAEAKRAGTVILTATVGGTKVASVNVKVQSSPVTTPPTCDVRPYGMRALVLKQSNTTAETQLTAIRRALGYVGIPYDEVAVGELGTKVQFASKNEPCHGNYQSVHMTDGSLRWSGNGLVDMNGLDLDTYRRNFKVRTVNWFVWPSPTFGFDTAAAAPVGTGEEISFTVTDQGRQQAFSYLSTNRIDVKNSFTYLAKPLPGAVPLLLDSSGNAGALIYNSDGMEMLTLTALPNEVLRHYLLLSYGLVNWSSRGRFLGNRRVYASAHVDDFLIPDHIWAPDTPCGSAPWDSKASYRIDEKDLSVVLSYQDRLHADPMYADFVLDMVYNGFGTGNRFLPDALTALSKQKEREFKWINHGFGHLFLDFVSYGVAYREVKNNQFVASKSHLNLTRYSDSCQVTAQVSGLKNPDYLRAAYDRGIRYLVTDTSRAGENPGDNLGLYNWFVPGIFMIPRRANNLFYNVALYEEWSAEYNCFFSSYWGRNLTVDEIIGFESESLLNFMLRGESYSWMFHQPNLRSYVPKTGGTVTTLLGELLDATFGKYKALYNLPVLSPTMEDLGKVVISHMEIKYVKATYADGIGMILESTIDTTTPVTGFHLPVGTTMKNIVYGGQKQTYVELKAKVPKFVPVPELLGVI